MPKRNRTRSANGGRLRPVRRLITSAAGLLSAALNLPVERNPIAVVPAMLSVTVGLSSDGSGIIDSIVNLDPSNFGSWSNYSGTYDE